MPGGRHVLRPDAAADLPANGCILHLPVPRATVGAARVAVGPALAEAGPALAEAGPALAKAGSARGDRVAGQDLPAHRPHCHRQAGGFAGGGARHDRAQDPSGTGGGKGGPCSCRPDGSRVGRRPGRLAAGDRVGAARPGTGRHGTARTGSPQPITVQPRTVQPSTVHLRTALRGSRSSGDRCNCRRDHSRSRRTRRGCHGAPRTARCRCQLHGGAGGGQASNRLRAGDGSGDGVALPGGGKRPVRTRRTGCYRGRPGRADRAAGTGSRAQQRRTLEDGGQPATPCRGQLTTPCGAQLAVASGWQTTEPERRRNPCRRHAAGVRGVTTRQRHGPPDRLPQARQAKRAARCRPVGASGARSSGLDARRWHRAR